MGANLFYYAGRKGFSELDALLVIEIGSAFKIGGCVAYLTIQLIGADRLSQGGVVEVPTK